MEDIYYNGKIITMEDADGTQAMLNAPEAVFIKDGIIHAVGTLEEIKQAASPRAKYIDLQGKCMMPAFIDSHSHICMTGQLALCASLSDCTSYGEIVQVLKQYIAANNIKQNGAVIGFGYDHNFLREEGHPDKQILDQVSTEIPIFILHISAHLACANSKALELANIDANTPNPEGGVVGRLPDGKEPSGYLEETGMSLVQKAVMGRVKINVSAVMASMQETYIKNGITTVQEGAASKSNIETLHAMSLADRLKIDVVAYPLMSDGGSEIIGKYKSLNRKYKNRLKIGGYKLVLDGSPQGRSAWMSTPYLGGEPDYCGYPWMPDEQVEQFVEQAISEGQQLLAHCNGDAASEQFLNAYEKALIKTGSSEDLRPVMIHCQTVQNDQLSRMSKLHMIASIFIGHVWYWGDVHLKNFGPGRGNHISPVKDAMDRGVLVNFHQDTPVTKPDMLHSVWCAVNRISRNGTHIGDEQKISVYDALKAVTLNAAYEYFEENSKGSIKTGKRADLVILDDSPLEKDPLKIKDITVLNTIKDGSIIYTLKDAP